MALQVWLPLDGDLRNLGLSDLKFSILGNYTTIDNGGKIGKCYKNSTYGQGGIVSNKTITLPVTLSWFCWINFSSLGTSSELNGVVSNHMPTSTPANMGITIKYLTSTTGKLSCSTGNGTNRTYKTYTGNTTLTAGVWYHIGFTYNGSKIKFYVNGVLDGETSYANQSQIAAKIGIFAWNMSSSSPYTYAVPGKLNDVRIYDHCLSEDEIHELSLGKVGHWKLNDYEISRSSLTSVTWNLLVKNGNFANGYTNWTTPNNATITIDSNKVVTITKTNGSGMGAMFASNVISVNTSHKYYISALLANGTVSAAFGFHASGGSVSSNTVLYSDSTTLKRYSAVVQPIRTTDILFVRCGNSASADGSTCKCANIICIDLTQMFGSGNEPTAAQFEEMFPLNYYPYDAGTVKDLTLPIPDISGNHYDLTANGNPTLSDDSARYDKSTLFNGSNYLSCTSPTAEAKTVSLWAYVGALPSANLVLFADYKSKLAIGFLPSLHGMLCRSVDNEELEFSDSLVLLNSWNHFCLVNGDTKQLYINGNTANKISYSSTWIHQSNVLMIGNRGYNNGTGYLNKISDVRIYATALSADDVLKLYKLGNV